MASRVLVSDTLSEAGLAILKDAPGIEVVYKPGLKEAELAAAIPGFDGLVIRSGSKVTAKVIEAAKGLKVIGRAGIGVDNVDVPAASQARHRGDEHADRQRRHHRRARARAAVLARATHRPRPPPR